MQVRDQGTLPRYNFYHSNGTGRDTYILHDSGGNMASKRSQKFESSKFMKTSTQYAPRVFKPQAKEKVLHYHSNGSGRDNYIITNSGGLLNNYMNVNHFFKTNLRANQSQEYFDIPRNRPLDSRQKYKRQRLQSARLSQPRLKNTPFQQEVDKAIFKEEKKKLRIQREKDIYSSYC